MSSKQGNVRFIDMDVALRADVSGVPRHLVVRGNNRLPCFVEDEDRGVYLNYLQESLLASKTEVHAYVLMTNHVHLLATGREADSVSRFMQQLNRRYSRYFNKAHSRTGTLYEGRYRSKLIQTEKHFLAAMRYIERNPVRAGMVANPAEYPWSSHRQNARGAPAGMLTPHPLYEGLGKDPDNRSRAYRNLFELPDDEQDLQVIRIGKVI
jgi:REP-associated tyrosine transposase